MCNTKLGRSLSSSKHVQEAVRNVRNYIEKEFTNLRLPKRASCPFPSNHRPEFDLSPELPPDQATFHVSQVGELRWTMELGRVDVITEVSMLASHSALPRGGHLHALLHVFGCLSNNHNATMVFDPTDLNSSRSSRHVFSPYVIHETPSGSSYLLCLIA